MRGRRVTTERAWRVPDRVIELAVLLPAVAFLAWVLWSVHHTGSGMSPDGRLRIIRPF
jgi:hypothetical protein